MIGNQRWSWFPTWEVRQPGTNISGSWLVREDTIAGKVFIRRWNKANEQLIYNDDWLVGDSLLVDNDYIFIHAVIVSRDSTLIQGVYHHAFSYIVYKDGFGIGGSTIVEGIGDLNSHSYLLVYPATMDAGFRLLCFFYHQAKPVLSPAVMGFNNSGNCIPMAVTNVPVRHQQARIVPNPVTRQSVLLLPEPVSSGSMYILDQTGSKVMMQELN